jgi:ribose transport system ATP-binding protein
LGLQISNLCKDYATPVLRNLDLQVTAGEIHGVVGENGAGKSTLLKILSGLTLPGAGTVVLDGEPLLTKNPQAAHRAGISLCSQELSLIDNLNVAENIGLRALPGRLGLDKALLATRCRSLLSELQLDLAPGTMVGSLNLAERQMVELAKTLNVQARLLLLDEPTSALNDQQAQALHRVLRERAKSGASVLYVSHRLNDVLNLCDYVWVLRDGEVVHHAPSGQLTTAELIRHMSGADALTQRRKDESRRPGPIHLSVRNLLTEKMQQPVSLDCHRGEIFGLAGLMGAGRTELLDAIYGLVPHSSGSVVLCRGEERIALSSVDAAIRSGVGMVPENRASHGIFAGLAVAFNTTIAELGHIATRHLLKPRREKAAVEKLIQRLNIKSEGVDQPIEALSGGNQQKVILARWLHRECSLLLLDEPTRGVDVAAKLAIHDLLRELRDQGLCVVIASSELQELLTLCDRIAVMSSGQLVRTFDRDEFNQDTILAAAFSTHNSAQVA